MTNKLTPLDVFVSGPSDVVPEKHLIKDVVDELNDLIFSSHGLVLNAKSWPDDFSTGVSVRGQEVINEQIRGNYEIFVGILWTRFGQPTGKFESGTREEFEHAYDDLGELTDPAPIHIYFKESPPERMSKVDPEQWERVTRFKQEVKDLGGVYHEFTTKSELERYVRQDLKRSALAVLGAEPGVESRDAASAVAGATESEPDDDDEAEVGFLDLLDRAESANQTVQSLAGEIIEATYSFGDDLEEHTNELEGIDPEAPDARDQIRPVLRAAADDMVDYAERVEELEEPLGQSLNRALDAWSKAVTLWDEDFDVDVAEVIESRNAAKETKSQLLKAASSVAEFEATTDSFPRITKRLTHAKAQVSSALGSLKTRLNDAAGQAGDTAEQLDVMVGRYRRGQNETSEED